MNFARYFVDRPIFAGVLSIAITLVGALSFFALPITQYPEVVPPTVVVAATYPGADAKTLAETVATPLEQEINGVENMLYLSSSSTADGKVQITVTFKLGTDLNQAQVLVQNRLNATLPRLPEEVRRLGVTAQKRSPDLTLAAQFFSPDGSRDVSYLANYVTLQVQNEIARLPGVAEASMLGGLDYSMRLWLDPEKIGALGLNAGDVVRAVREQNVQVAAGSLGQPPAAAGLEFQYTLTAPGRLKTPEQFGDIVLKTGAQGEVARLRDVARIELGSRDYSTRTYMDGKNAVSLRVFQLPGSNALDTANAVYARLGQLKERFPPGIDFRTNYDTTKFVRASIRSVLQTLLEAVLLVVVVVIVFLQTWRASLIPLLAVPVSLIGTLAVMQALGFSLNNLSLFGLVLAIGIVVDDAIVVVENIERNIGEGLAPRAAAHKAMEEVSGAVIAVALVLCAVFIPTAFISGITGQFYKQFALTIAVSTVISAFNSLTLSPALGALLIRPHDRRDDLMTRLLNFVFGWFFRLFNKSFDWASQAYAGLVRRLVRLTVLVLVAYAALAGLGGWLFKSVPGGFIPPQDMGYMIAVVQLPDAAAFERTDAVVRRVDDIARKTPGIAHTFALSGYSSVLQASQSNLGAAFFILDDFENRKSPELQSDQIIARLRREFASIQEARVIVLPPPALRGLGNAGGFKIQVQDLNNAGLPALEAATQKLLAAAQKDPALNSLITGFRANSPQYHIDLDRAQAKTMGVSLADINEALQVYLGSSYVNDFNLFGRTYQVTAQADPIFRADPSDLSRIKVRNQAGDMVPLSAVTTVVKRGGTDRVQRYNLYYSADISGNTGPGVSSSQMIDRITRLARDTLPDGFDFAWTDLTYQQLLAGNSITYIFPLCVLFVFLVLAALYESWSLPLAIILIVPMCLLSAIGGVWLLDRDNNIFTQIGLVVLVGLAAKNAILIVEFAKQKQDAGMNRLDAAVEACRLRLRPILMTSCAFILGVLPLVLARGAGAEMRQALGTAVFFGMLGVTLFGLLFTPVFYVAIRAWIERKRKPEATGH
jgi:hydrophobe/amphiphile efflux-1 (HAE1) family protein